MSMQPDARKWWRVACSAWPTFCWVEARSARSAISTIKRDLAEAERCNGRSRRDTSEWLSVQTFEASGPLTAVEAFSEEFGWALAYEMCRWSADHPVSPATTAEALRGFVSEKKISTIRRRLAKSYGLPESKPPVEAA